MALHLFVFVLLLVVCLLLLLVRLGRLDWFSLQPFSSKGVAKRSRLHRLLKPRTPDDCPACRLTSLASSAGVAAQVPVRPWREVKSRRCSAFRPWCKDMRKEQKVEVFRSSFSTGRKGMRGWYRMSRCSYVFLKPLPLGLLR